MRRHILGAMMAGAGLLAACGGGGGSDADSSAVDVSLSGTAAKGLMAGATVSAHAVRADGSMDEAALATATTDAQGAYTLAFSGVKDQPVVIRVTASEATTHIDELTGETRPLAPGFQMRSLVVPSVTGTVATRASITPFSEMAVAAAQKADGGLTAANAAQAVSTVTQLLGFNPVTVQVAPASEAATVEQQQMAVMLAAVSQLASDGAIGCADGDDAAKTRCVVETLAASAATGTLKLSTATVDVSASLADAVTKVFDNPTAVATIPRTTIDVAVANLGCTTDCAVAIASPSSDAIAAARSLFTQLKTDIATVFLGSGSSAADGPANAQALAFGAAMRDVQLPAEMVAKDLGALLMGVDLYHDYKAGRTTSPNRQRGEGMVSNDTLGFMGAAGCTLFQDSATTLTATAPDNANFIGCSAHYYVQADPQSTTRWRHGFTITPAADGSFTYQSRARRTCAGTLCPGGAGNFSLQASSYLGTLTPTLTEANGRIIGFAVSGKLPGAFVAGGTTLVDAYSDWALQGTRTISGFRQEIASLTGTVTSHAEDDAVRGTLAINAARSTEIAVTATGARPSESDPATQGELAAIGFDLRWTTSAAEFAGVFRLDDSQWDKSGTTHAPTTALLSGSLRNVVDGTAREFAAGSLTARITGFGDYDDTLDGSETNTFTVETSFTGTITAPDRPVLELTVAGSARPHASGPVPLTMQYRTLVNGTPRTVVAISRSVPAGAAPVVRLSEASANLSLEWAEGASTASLKAGDATIGTLDLDAMRLTFSDNSFMSLDLGL